MKLYFYDYVNSKDKMYFSAINYNGLFEYSYDTLKTRLLTVFDKDEVGELFLHSRILKYNSSLWLIPNNSKYIYEYNLCDETLSSYSFLKKGMKGNRSFFLNCEILDGKLYLFPCRYEGILVFDLEMKKVEKIIKLDDSWVDSSGLYSFKGGKIHENKLYIANMNKDMYEIIDLVTENRKKVYLEERYGGITHLLICGKEIIVVGRCGKIGVYGMDGEKRYITQFKSGLTGPKFYDVCENGGIIYLTENDTNSVALYDYKANQQVEIEYPINKEKAFENFWANALFIKCSNNRVFLQSAFDGYVYSIEGGAIRKIADVNWIISDEERERLVLKKSGIITEQYGCDLKQFMEKVVLS